MCFEGQRRVCLGEVSAPHTEQVTEHWQIFFTARASFPPFPYLSVLFLSPGMFLTLREVTSGFLLCSLISFLIGFISRFCSLNLSQ